MKIISLLAAVALALALAACGSNSSSAPAHPAAAAPAALTSAEGASICNDLQAWWKVAYPEVHAAFRRPDAG